MQKAGFPPFHFQLHPNVAHCVPVPPVPAPGLGRPLVTLLKGDVTEQFYKAAVICYLLHFPQPLHTPLLGQLVHLYCTVHLYSTHYSVLYTCTVPYICKVPYISTVPYICTPVPCSYQYSTPVHHCSPKKKNEVGKVV